MEEQSGFRTGRSCINNILPHTVNIKKKATGQGIHLVFVDIMKKHTHSSPPETVYMISLEVKYG
jgi:hypothetical protein